MTTKRLVWKKPDGSIAFTVPVEPARAGESEAAYLDRIAARCLASDPGLAGATRLPDHDHADLAALGFMKQNAWAWDGAAVKVNAAKLAAWQAAHPQPL